MTVSYNFFPILYKSGIQRDGTIYNSQSCVDGQHIRFTGGTAKKIGGYEVTDLGNSEIIRKMFMIPKNSGIDLYMGRQSSVNYINIQPNSLVSTEIDRTPVSGFVPDPKNLWCFEQFTDIAIGGGFTSEIVAHVAKNNNDISSIEEGPVFYGDVYSNDPLTQVTLDNDDPLMASGGIVSCVSILVAYGNDGVIRFSTPGKVDKWPVINYVIVTSTKIIKALPRRGTTTPSILIWSLNNLSIGTYAAGLTEEAPPTFLITPVSGMITIMSSNCIVEMNNTYYWIGENTFYYYNGTTNVLQNDMNKEWFFRNVNKENRQKIWGVPMPAYGEIWWFFPDLDSEECNRVIVYNVLENFWWDSRLGRSAGVCTFLYEFPLFADSNLIETSSSQGNILTYPIWSHEKGLNRVIGQKIYAIDSYFETPPISPWSSDPKNAFLFRNRGVAPDFVVEGNMTLTVKNRRLPQSSPIVDGPYTFKQDTEVIDTQSQGSVVSFLFRSNEINGYFEDGKSLYLFNKGDTFK